MSASVFWRAERGERVLASGESHVLSCSRVARKREDREGTRAEVEGYLAHKKEELKRFTRKKVDRGWSETCGEPHVGERVLASGESHVLQLARCIARPVVEGLGVTGVSRL